MFKRIKGLLDDIHDINLTLRDIYNKSIFDLNYDNRIHYDLQNISEKLNTNNKSNNVKQLRKPSHSVWLMNQDETKCVLTNDISIFKNVIKVNGLDFDKYESEEKAKEEFTEICNWIASGNPAGTGIYQLTK
jgi:hypothetical protein